MKLLATAVLFLASLIPAQISADDSTPIWNQIVTVFVQDSSASNEFVEVYANVDGGQDRTYIVWMNELGIGSFSYQQGLFQTDVWYFPLSGTPATMVNTFYSIE